MAREEEAAIPFGDATMPAALALPESGAGQWPGVVVIHELLGLNDDIRRITARFADAGYAAVAPDLFAGLGPMPFCIARTLAAYRGGGGRPLQALDATCDWLGNRADVNESRLGVAGFCMGGGFALLLAVRSRVGAAATFYGDVPRRAADLEGICPVVSGYGGRDLLFGRKGRQLERHLDDLDVSHDVKTYPGAGHSYMSRHGGVTSVLGRWSPLRAGYDEAAAEDSWARMLEFFARHLGAT